MKTTEHRHHFDINSSDENGEFLFRVHKPLGITTQLTIESQDGDNSAYINVDKKELTEIRDSINKALALFN